MPQPRQGGQRREAKLLDEQSRQVGSRWHGHAPTGEQVAKWFAENVELHEGMEHDHYVQGVTLITQVESFKTLHDGQIIERNRLVHVPYAKVETRVAYFWNLCLQKDWMGVIEPVDVPRVDAQGLNNTNLPRGFFRVPVPVVQGNQSGYVHFIACAMKVSIFEKDMRAGVRGRLVLDAPQAVKQIPLLDRYGKADPFALMKAETGAVGRALGMAGMLVLPGSGVATAEDMQEVEAATGAGVSPEQEPQLPEEATAPAPDPMADLMAMIARLESDAPGKLEEVEAWAAERRPPINLREPKSTQIRALRAQVERKLREHDETAT